MMLTTAHYIYVWKGDSDDDSQCLGHHIKI